ncbi:uncharacterized protein MYCFIDRAFT_180149 [Pseudocercospora fijiensis CIRAD86]|uniref:Uncharacterized protein n=1 Tax=Pseudocercospora fijiensis (strain CIRAD86) TaxID=383855 RepID=M2YH46_PSEFD|nr:uncharacterized protein MYCFIDRAFT_180149 [Pseudocercospora fijiensis CIRAD86]EME77145.1 hypothetical protein MYCFIDRAFT_180149 [Pseudocercospora fijiensis CIRAD86]
MAIVFGGDLECVSRLQLLHFIFGLLDRLVLLPNTSVTSSDCSGIQYYTPSPKLVSSAAVCYRPATSSSAGRQRHQIVKVSASSRLQASDILLLEKDCLHNAPLRKSALSSRSLTCRLAITSSDIRRRPANISRLPFMGSHFIIYAASSSLLRESVLDDYRFRTGEWWLRWSTSNMGKEIQSFGLGPYAPKSRCPVTHAIHIVLGNDLSSCTFSSPQQSLDESLPFGRVHNGFVVLGREMFIRALPSTAWLASVMQIKLNKGHVASHTTVLLHSRATSPGRITVHPRCEDPIHKYLKARAEIIDTGLDFGIQSIMSSSMLLFGCDLEGVMRRLLLWLAITGQLGAFAGDDPSNGARRESEHALKVLAIPNVPAPHSQALEQLHLASIEASYFTIMRLLGSDIQSRKSTAAINTCRFDMCQILVKECHSIPLGLDHCTPHHITRAATSKPKVHEWLTSLTLLQMCHYSGSEQRSTRYSSDERRKAALAVETLQSQLEALCKAEDQIPSDCSEAAPVLGILSRATASILNCICATKNSPEHILRPLHPESGRRLFAAYAAYMQPACRLYAAYAAFLQPTRCLFADAAYTRPAPHIDLNRNSPSNASSRSARNLSPAANTWDYRTHTRHRFLLEASQLDLVASFSQDLLHDVVVTTKGPPSGPPGRHRMAQPSNLSRFRGGAEQDIEGSEMKRRVERLSRLSMKDLDNSTGDIEKVCEFWRSGTTPEMAAGFISVLPVTSPSRSAGSGTGYKWRSAGGVLRNMLDSYCTERPLNVLIPAGWDMLSSPIEEFGHDAGMKSPYCRSRTFPTTLYAHLPLESVTAAAILESSSCISQVITIYTGTLVMDIILVGVGVPSSTWRRWLCPRISADFPVNEHLGYPCLPSATSRQESRVIDFKTRTFPPNSSSVCFAHPNTSPRDGPFSSNALLLPCWYRDCRNSGGDEQSLQRPLWKPIGRDFVKAKREASRHRCPPNFLAWVAACFQCRLKGTSMTGDAELHLSLNQSIVVECYVSTCVIYDPHSVTGSIVRVQHHNASTIFPLEDNPSNPIILNTESFGIPLDACTA